jgi:hypothetical protein
VRSRSPHPPKRRRRAAARIAGGTLPDTLTVDGVLSEPAWNDVPAAETFTQSEPAEGAAPMVHTAVRVLAGSRALAIGIVCDDPAPNDIVSFQRSSRCAAQERGSRSHRAGSVSRWAVRLRLCRQTRAVRGITA